MGYDKDYVSPASSDESLTAADGNGELDSSNVVPFVLFMLFVLAICAWGLWRKEVEEARRRRRQMMGEETRITPTMGRNEDCCYRTFSSQSANKQQLVQDGQLLG